jgi:hypothetical protein
MDKTASDPRTQPSAPLGPDQVNVLLLQNCEETVAGPKIPLCAAISPTFIEATRPKEINAFMTFGRDSNWPLKITATSTLDDQTSLSMTYGSDWADCDGSIEWVWTKFVAADGITKPPAFDRPDVKRCENNAMHILLREASVNGVHPTIHEDPGLPAMTLYGPNAIIKLRRQTPWRVHIQAVSRKDEGDRTASGERVGDGRISWK